jgi:hypothetical protein
MQDFVFQIPTVHQLMEFKTHTEITQLEKQLYEQATREITLLLAAHASSLLNNESVSFVFSNPEIKSFANELLRAKKEYEVFHDRYIIDGNNYVADSTLIVRAITTSSSSSYCDYDDYGNYGDYIDDNDNNDVYSDFSDFIDFSDFSNNGNNDDNGASFSTADDNSSLNCNDFEVTVGDFTQSGDINGQEYHSQCHFVLRSRNRPFRSQQRIQRYQPYPTRRKR